MKDIIVVLLCALVAASAVDLRAGDDPPGKPPAPEAVQKRREEWQKLSPEQREAKLKEWRKTNGGPMRAEWEKRREQYKKMTAEERAAKRAELKARLEKRIAELQGKQTNATITPAELRELGRREQILSKFRQAGSGGTSIERPGPREPAAPPPPEQ